MSLLRIYCPSLGVQQQCQWALFDGSGQSVTGEGPFAQLPQGADRVELVLSASQMLITRVRLPKSARRHSAPLLAYAVEDKTISESEANQVSWLGSAGGSDVLAVTDRRGLEQWRAALAAAGVRAHAVLCETLMLPLAPEAWSVAWNGQEGFVRTGEFEGSATDRGDRQAPPLVLRLMLEDAIARNASPKSITLHPTTPAALPDMDAWRQSLGTAIAAAGPWDWRTAKHHAGASLMQETTRWRLKPWTLSRLRPAAWIAGLALAIHGVALAADWTKLAGEQRALRERMDARFRATFPDTVAVADATLQMRRKLAEARHAVNQPDDGDFPEMLAMVAPALGVLPAGALRAMSYEGRRMTLQLAGDEALVRRISQRLLQAGLGVETLPAAARAGRDAATITVSAP